MRKWDDIWGDFKRNFLIKVVIEVVARSQEKTLKNILKKIALEKNSTIIDVGCRTGSTLSFFRNLGFKNSIGIDISPNAIKLCNKLFNFKEGKDVFLQDVRDIDSKFKLVFSDGLLEHYQDALPIVEGINRISNGLILLFQPNQDNFFAPIKYKLGSNFWEREFHYTKEDYLRMFKPLTLVDSGRFCFNQFMWLLFKH